MKIINILDKITCNQKLKGNKVYFFYLGLQELHEFDTVQASSIACTYKYKKVRSLQDYLDGEAPARNRECFGIPILPVPLVSHLNFSTTKSP